MRRRMLFSTLVVTVIAVMLLGLPLGALSYKTVYNDNLRQLDNEADMIGADVDTELDDDGGIVDRQHFASVYPERRIRITLPGRPKPIVAGGWTVDPEATDAPETLKAATTTQRNVKVEVWRSTTQIRDDIINSWLGIASLSLLAIGVAVGLAMLQARRMTLPLVDLAATAERLGSGVTAPWGHRYGIPEADRVAEVLDSSAERIAGLIATERHFATDASHQLRTPLAALSMRLEELIAEADNPDVVREEGEAALAQAERLVEIVDNLLGRARKSQHPEVEPVSVDDALHAFVAEWAPILRKEGRELRLTGTEGLAAMAVPSDLSQVLATLVENAHKHGAGTVTLHRTEEGGSIRIEVSDEGEGIPDDISGRIFEREVSGGNGTGLGLALARHIAESEGARVELVQASPTTFALFLPTTTGGPPKSTGPV